MSKVAAPSKPAPSKIAVANKKQALKNKCALTSHQNVPITVKRSALITMMNASDRWFTTCSRQRSVQQGEQQGVP